MDEQMAIDMERICKWKFCKNDKRNRKDKRQPNEIRTKPNEMIFFFCYFFLPLLIYCISSQRNDEKLNEESEKNKSNIINHFSYSQEALHQLRGVSSSGLGRTSEPIETLQSRAREWEKKVCVMIVCVLICDCVLFCKVKRNTKCSSFSS